MASWHEDFVLGDWLVSPKLNRISKNGQAVSIKHKSMLVLVALADAKGEVLTRNEIMDSVWPGMEVTDDVLTQSVVELRKAFNDEARQPRYIETIPRVGFRLLPMVAQPATTSKAPNPRYALVAVVAIAIGSLTWLGIDRLSSERNPVITTQDPIAIAVLPFVNMSDDPANEYFSDSMSEELANVLVRIPSLRVTSRTSTFSYRGSDKKLTVIGDELGVTYIIEGSVRKTGSRIKVAVQLVEVESDTHLWSETYTRELADIFAIQEQIAQSVVAAMRYTLSGAEEARLAQRPTDNIEAYNEYLIGRHLWNQRRPDLLSEALQHLNAAVLLDPDFDEAWAAIADVYVVAAESGVGSIEENIRLGRQAVGRALAVNPESAHALAASGSFRFYEYDWEGANADLKRALELAPDYATAHHWYAETLWVQGRTDEARYHMRLARQADPVSVVIRYLPGLYLLWDYQFDEAEQHFMDVLALGGEPFPATIIGLEKLNSLRGDFDEARRRARQFAELTGIDPTADLARIDAMENPALKERALNLLQQRDAEPDGAFGKALEYALLNEYEMALANLELGFASGDAYAPAMSYMKVYEPLRDDPRFQAMLKKMNLLP